MIKRAKDTLKKSLAALLVVAVSAPMFSTNALAATNDSTQSILDKASVSADFNTTYQTMDGVGAAYAYTSSINMMQLATAGHQDTVQHILNLTFDQKNGVGHDICRVIIGNNGTLEATGTAASPGYNPETGLLADVNNPGFDVEGNEIPLKGSAGKYGYKITKSNRYYDGNTDSIWPVEPEHESGTLVPLKDFVWDYDSWNTPIANDKGGPTNLVDSLDKDPVIIKNSARTKKELFDYDQVWTMLKAQQYGVKNFYACNWDAPYWMSKSSNSTNKIIRDDVATIDGKDVKIYYQAYADYLVYYVKGMWEQWGIPINYLNPFNEPDLAGANAAYMKELIDDYIGPTFKKAEAAGGALNGIKDPSGKVIDFVPQLCASDGCNLSASINTVGPVFNETDEATATNKNPYLDVFTTHLYGTVNIGTDDTNLTHSGDFAKKPLDSQVDTSKYPDYLNNYKLWQAEFMNQDTGDGSAGAYTNRYNNQNINDGVRYAQLMTNMFTSNPGFNAYVWWSMWDNNGCDGSDLIRFVSTNSQQNAGHTATLTGEYRLFKRFYTFGHFSRFMNPGDKRIEVTRAPADGIDIVGFKTADNKDYSITISNAKNDDTIKPLEFSLKNFPAGTKSITVFRTSNSENQKKLAETIPVVNGKFTVNIPSASVVTLVPSEGTYATYNGLDGERDIFSSLEAEDNDTNTKGDTAGNAGRDNEAVTLADNKFVGYKNINFADGSANGGVVRRHLLYLTAQAKSATGGSIMAYVVPTGTDVASVDDIKAKGKKVGEILVPVNGTYDKYQAMLDTGDLGAYGHKDLYLVACANKADGNITVDRFLFGANDSDWSTAGNNSTVSIPGNVITNGDFDTSNSNSIANWNAGTYNDGKFELDTSAATLTADSMQSYTGLSRALKSSWGSKVAASAKITDRTTDENKYDGMWQDLTGKLTVGEKYKFDGQFLEMKSGDLGYDVAAENPGDVVASLVYYDADGNELSSTPIGGRDMPEPYAAREAADRAYWDSTGTLQGEILAAAPVGLTSFQAAMVKIADWHQSDSNEFTYAEPEGTAKVVLAVYSKDSNILYSDLLSITPTPDRTALRDALKSFTGSNKNIADVAASTLASTELSQATVDKMVKALNDNYYEDMATTLTGLSVDGTPLSDFAADKLDYEMTYPIDKTPTITYDKFDENAAVNVENAAGAPTKATITVTNGEAAPTVYTIDFKADLSLTGIKVNNLPLNTFDKDTTDYTVRIPDGTDAAELSATAADPKTTIVYDQPSAIPGTGKITVSYGDKSKEYNVNVMKNINGSDEFNDETLDTTFWNWTREDPTEWSLTETPGSMSILTRKGDIYGGGTPDMKNMLLQDAPGDWQIDTKVVAESLPKDNYQQGALLAYQDDDNYLKLSWEPNNGSTTQTKIQVAREINAGVSASQALVNNADIKDNTMYLRIIKNGTNYTSFYSLDGTNYKQVGDTYSLPLNNLKTGLSASNGGGTDDESARIHMNFDYFHTTAAIGELLSDKSKLNEQVTAAQNFVTAQNKDDYSEKTWNNLETALTEAKALQNNNNADQSDIDTKTEDLKNAAANVISVSNLRTVINNNADLVESEYTPATWSTYSSALTAANDALKNATDDATVTTAKEDLENAVKGLKKTADKTALKASVDAASTVNKDDYTENSYNSLKDALTTANALLTNGNAVQTDVDTAKDAVDTAKNKLVNIAGLRTSTTDAAKLSEKDYTPATWSVFTKALENANTVLANKAALASDVDTAKANLDTAVKNLVDTTALSETSTKAEALNEKDYTPATWSLFVRARDNAKTVLAKDDATKEDIDAANAELNEAMKNLVKVAPIVDDNKNDNAGTNTDVTAQKPQNNSTTGTNANVSNPLTGSAAATATVIFVAVLIISLALGAAFISRKKRI